MSAGDGMTHAERATYQALVARGVPPEAAREDALDGVTVEDARKVRARTHDELEPLEPGATVHTVSRATGKCVSTLVHEVGKDKDGLNGLLVLGHDNRTAFFDRAGQHGAGVPGSWHYADHGEWRDA